MAIEIKGNWVKGFALDLHTLSSEFIGDDEFGHPQFDTTRSEVGELVYQLKYHNDVSVLSQIVDKIKTSIAGIGGFDFILPIPPTNIQRVKQPVELVCNAMSIEFGVSVLNNMLSKNKITEEIKNVVGYQKRLELLRKSMILNNNSKLENKNIFLIDDLYGSGATLTVATELLYGIGKVQNVFVLTLTKKRKS